MKDWRKASIFFIPFVQLAANPAVFVSPSMPFIDPWIYTGFFLDFPQFLHEFAGTYYPTRLSWILPGYWLHHLLPPVAANYVLHVGFYTALLFAVYGFMSACVGRDMAFFAAIVFAWNPAVLSAMSWDYVDGAGMLYEVCTLGCLERSFHSDKRRSVWLFGAGGAAALAACSNLFVTMMFPAFLLYFVFRSGRRPASFFVSSVAASLLGFAATIAVLGLINQSAGGEFAFFMPSVNFSNRLLSHPNPWKIDSFAWLLSAYWLVLPLSALVGALLFLWKRRGERDGLGMTSPWSLQACFLAGALIWTGFELTGSPMLACYYYVSYLVPLALLALVFQAGPASGHDTRRMSIWAWAACAGFFAEMLWAVHGHVKLWSFLSLPSNLNTFRIFIVFVILAAMVVAVSVLRFSRRSFFRMAVFIVCVALLNAATRDRDLSKMDSGEVRAGYRAVVEAHRFIRANCGDREPRFWYSAKEPMVVWYCGISSSYLWAYRLMNETFPSVKAEEAKALLENKRRLVLIVSEKNGPAEAEKALKVFGVSLTSVASQRFEVGPDAFRVLLFDPVPISPVAGSSLVVARNMDEGYNPDYA